MAVSWSKAIALVFKSEAIAPQNIGRGVKIEKIILLDGLWAGFLVAPG
jgi:hypothetical protein